MAHGIARLWSQVSASQCLTCHRHYHRHCPARDGEDSCTQERERGDATVANGSSGGVGHGLPKVPNF